MELIRQNKTVIRFAKHMLYLKKYQPAKYKIISSVTDGVLLCAWILLSLGIALYMVYEGYTTFDAALVGVCIVDLNVFGFGAITGSDLFTE